MWKMIEGMMMDKGSSTFRVLWGPSALIVIAAVLVSIPVFDGAFVWDDVLLIQNNTALEDLQSAWRTAWGDFFQQGGAHLSQSGFFRPIPSLLNAVTVGAFGKTPLAFHLGNLLIHVATCLIGMFLLMRLGWSVRAATFSLVLFSLHPVQAESLAYISCRPELCAAFGTVLGLWCYDRYRRSGWRPGLTLAMAAYLGALLSKEVAIGLIVVCVWLEITQYEKRAWPAVLAMVIPVFVYGVLRALCLDTHAVGRFALTEQPWVALNLVAFYFKKLCIPGASRALYEHLSLTGIQWSSLLGLCLVGGLIFLLLKEAHRQKVIAFGGLWLLVFLSPVLHLVPFGTIAAERYLYLPMFGFAAILGWGMAFALEGGTRWRPVIMGGVVLILIGSAVTSAMRTTVWSSELTLWSEEVIQSDPHHSAFANIGTALAESGRLREAHAAYDRAWALAPGHRSVFRNLMRLEARGLPPELRADFLTTVLNPKVSADRLRQWEARLRKFGAHPIARRLEERAQHIDRIQ